MRAGVVVRHAILALSLFLAVQTAIASETAQRILTFDERVRAQTAIERVYYSHQIGATKPFEQAVTRAFLEAKVQKYLDETAALLVYWKTAVTDEMLERELERMAHESKMPERLLELYAALGNDPFLVKECLARPTLVDRMARDFHAFDPTLHVESRRRAEELHRQLATGELSPTTDHPNRSVAELVMSETATQKPEGYTDLNINTTRPFRRELVADEFRKQRAQLPDGVGHASAIKEQRDAFVFSVVLSERDGEVRVANYVIPRTSWDDWWATSKIGLRGELTATVALDRGPLPKPTGNFPVGANSTRLGASGSLCDRIETWTPTSTTGAPSARFYHTAVWTGSLMVVWGGATAPPPSTPVGGTTQRPTAGRQHLQRGRRRHASTTPPCGRGV